VSAIERIRGVAWTAALSFDREAGTRQAAQLSFYLLLTFPALLLLAVWIISNLFDSPGIRDDLIEEIVSNLPLTEVEGRKQVSDFLEGLTSGAGSLGLVSAGVLLYSASSTVGALRHAVVTANEDGRDGPPFPKNKGLDILITLVTLPVILLLVALSISRPLSRQVDDSPLLSDIASTFGGPVAISLLGLMFLIWMYWVLNPGRSDWLSVTIGGLVATALVTLVSTGLQLWFGVAGDGSAVYGFLAAFIGVLIFLNLASMAIVYGAHLAATIRSKPWLDQSEARASHDDRP
jgi:YihY family inner membrane protein